ncbi:MAG TPA: alkaline phosphatase D family protein [Alphaproteobacteria bacterium]|nr:alkaline phosphatase D family protein [Alphaproteobacteria bacterium]
MGGDCTSDGALPQAQFRGRDVADVAMEFCGTSITSQSARQEVFDALLPENPHIRFVDSTYRGYTRMRLTQERCLADIRVVDTVAWRAAPVRTLAAFAVENGRLGVQKA